MPISVSCEHCGVQLKAKDSLASQEINCPKCNNVITVPEPDVVVEIEPESLIEISEISDDLSSWDLSNLIGESSTAPEFADDPFGLPAMELPASTSYPTATPLQSIATYPSAQTKPNPIRPKTNAKSSKIGIAIGAGAIAILLIAGIGGVLISLFLSPPETRVITTIDTPAHPDVMHQVPSSEYPKQSEHTVASTPQKEEEQDRSVEPSPTVKPVVVYDTEALKAATVLVKMLASTESKSGTAFLIESNSTEGYLIASAGIVTPSVGIANEINCVFNSGTPQEFVATAAMVGKDERLDLAILKVQHTNLPTSIPLETQSLPAEQMKVIAFGFPSTGSESVDGKNPTIATTTGTITSIEKDDYETPKQFQISRPFSLGDSGGPVFDENGHLLGFTISREPSGGMEGIVVPRNAFVESFAGRVNDVVKYKNDRTDNRAGYVFSIRLLDPCNSIESVAIYTFAKNGQNAWHPLRTGKWELASEKFLDRAECNVSPKYASGQVILPPNVDDVVLQYYVKRKGGTEWFSAPIPLSQEADGPADLSKRIQSPSSPAVQPTTPKSGASPSSDEPTNSSLAASPASPPTPKPSPSQNEAQLIQLTASFSDFTINPRTGEVAAICPQQNAAMLLRAPDYSVEKALTVKLPTSSNPISIRYKKFGDAEYFAVICSQDSAMYLIDTKDFKVAHEVLLDGFAKSKIAVSTNEKDPFIYYCYLNDQWDFVGAVNLREMKSFPKVIERNESFVLSADGTQMYCYFGNQFRSFTIKKLRNSFDDARPEFIDRNFGEADRVAHIPSPNGEYTACGTKVYSGDLAVHYATLDFSPECFLTTKPALIGTDERSFVAASYNTMKKYPNSVRIRTAHNYSDSGVKYAGLPQGFNPWLKGYDDVFLADEINGCVIRGYVDELCIVPFSALGIQDEPLLGIDISPTEITVGGMRKISITPKHEGTEVTFDKVPNGVLLSDGVLEWSPTDAQIGAKLIVAQLKYGTTTRTVRRYINVTQPYIQVPIEISDFVVDENEEFAVCWSFGFGEKDLSEADKKKGNNPTPKISVVPFKRDGKAQTIELMDPIESVQPFGERLAVRHFRQPNRVDIYERSTLKRIKTLHTEEEVVEIRSTPEHLLVLFESTMDIYQASTLKLIRTTPFERLENQNPRDSQFGNDLLIDGMLIDKNKLTPRLLLNTHSIRRLERPDQGFIGQTGLPMRPWQVGLSTHRLTFDTNHPQEIVTQSYVVMLTFLSPRSDIEREVLIVNEPIDKRARYYDPTLRFLKDYVLVSDGKKIYRWKLSNLLANKEQKELAPAPFFVEPQQSAFVVKGAKQTLKHVTHGGTAPFEFVAVRPSAGVSINESTGVVSLDTDAIAEAAGGILRIPKDMGPEKIDEEQNRILSEAAQYAESVNERFKVKLQGYPVAVPIHFKVVDAEGRVAEMRYYVVVDLSARQIRKVLQRKQ